MSALIAAVSALLVLFVGQYLTKWRDDRTKRIQLTMGQAEKQLSEFYSPLLSFVEQLDTIAKASGEIDKAENTEKPAIAKIMWDDLYSPVHEEILTILKTKIHLIEGFDIRSSFTLYLHHYASQKIYWQLVANGHPIPTMKTVGYPEEFYWDIRNGLYLVTKKYENSLQELRNPIWPELRNRFFPKLRRYRFFKLPEIGWLSIGSEFSDAYVKAAFSRGLNEVGYFENGNVKINCKWAETMQQVAVLAESLVRSEVKVIVAGGTRPALAAKAATATIPIVFAAGVGPCELSLVLNRPSGNLTGVTFSPQLLEWERMRLLQNMVPQLSKVAVLLNPDNPFADTQLEKIREVASALGVRLHVQRASTELDIKTAFSAITIAKANGLLVASDSLFTNNCSQIIALTKHHKIPAMYEWRTFPEAGGLMSYGTSTIDAFRQAGIYAGQILNGIKAADLAVKQSMKVELVINLVTAKALGLEVPKALLDLADHVVE